MVQFISFLVGAEEIPPVCTKSRAVLQLKCGKKSLKYKICVKHIKNVTEANLHLGRPGENGPIVATLFRGCTEKIHGQFVKGSIKKKDLRGPLQCSCVQELVALIRSGYIYANINTNQYPNGKIRGQVYPKGDCNYGRDFADGEFDGRERRGNRNYADEQVNYDNGY